jgi:hypothetical protein
MKNMSSILLIIVISTSIISNTAFGQDGNISLACSTYENISINGHTINEINSTEGQPQSLKDLLGSYTSMNNSDSFWERTFKYDTNTLLISYDHGYNNGKMTNITINNSPWSIIVDGKLIEIGNSVTQLKNKFGDTLEVGISPYFKENFITLGCSGNDYDGWVINIDSETNKVYKIEYFINP